MNEAFINILSSTSDCSNVEPSFNGYDLVAESYIEREPNSVCGEVSLLSSNNPAITQLIPTYPINRNTTGLLGFEKV
jgi:hypothetical protein